MRRPTVEGRARLQVTRAPRATKALQVTKVPQAPRVRRAPQVTKGDRRSWSSKFVYGPLCSGDFRIETEIRNISSPLLAADRAPHCQSAAWCRLNWWRAVFDNGPSNRSVSCRHSGGLDRTSRRWHRPRFHICNCFGRLSYPSTVALTFRQPGHAGPRTGRSIGYADEVDDENRRVSQDTCETISNKTSPAMSWECICLAGTQVLVDEPDHGVRDGAGEVAHQIEWAAPERVVLELIAG